MYCRFYCFGFHHICSTTFMPLPPDVAHDIPFEVIDLTPEEKRARDAESDPEKKKEMMMVYEGVRFRRRFHAIPSLVGQQSLEQANMPPPQGPVSTQIRETLAPIAPLQFQQPPAPAPLPSAPAEQAPRE